MQTRKASRIPSQQPPTDPEVFHVTTIYDDFGNGLRAKRLCDRLQNALGTGAPTANQFWKMGALGLPGVGDCAAREAAAADLLILSTHGCGLPPDCLKDWMTEWSAYKAAPGGAMVAIFDRDGGLKPGREYWHAYLCEVARGSGMTYFTTEAGAIEAPAFVSAPEGTFTDPGITTIPISFIDGEHTPLPAVWF